MSDLEEEFVPEDEAEIGPALVKSLREKLKKAVAEKQEYLEGWQRSRADFVNFKREEAGLQSDKEARAKMQVIEAFIPALDALELSIRNSSFEKAPKEWQDGMKAVYNEFKKALERLGVEQHYPLAEAVDHRKHEVLREVPVGDTQSDQKIVEVHRSGYLLEDKVIRPAQVSVGVVTK